jgi:hypothetical protein
LTGEPCNFVGKATNKKLRRACAKQPKIIQKEKNQACKTQTHANFKITKARISIDAFFGFCTLRFG